MLNEAQFADLHSRLEAGGFTVNPRTGDHPTTGWMVSAPGAEHRAPISAGPAALQAYSESHAQNWANGAFHGGWRSGDEGVQDVSWRHGTSPGEFLRAAGNMHRNNQEAMYNLGTEQSYWNMNHPNVHGGKSVPEQMATPEAQENAGVHRQWAQARLKSKYPQAHQAVMASGGYGA